MTERPIRYLIAALLALVAALSIGPVSAEESAEGGAPIKAKSSGTTAVDSAIRLERRIRQQYKELIAAMHQVARDLEQSDPDTAAAMATAAQQAEAALLEDDMEKVINLLRSGLLIPADATQAEIVKRLRTVLSALRGGKGDLEARVFQLKQLKQLIAFLNELLKRQRDLERTTHLLIHGDAEHAKLKQLAGDVADVIRQQKSIRDATDTLSFSPGVKMLTDRADSLIELTRRLETIGKALSNRFPSPDEMAGNLALVRSVASEAQEAKIAIRTLTNDPEVEAALKPAGKHPGALVKSLDALVNELNAAAKALASDELGDARVAAAEGKLHLDAAIASLQAAVESVGGTKGAGVLSKQQSLIATAGALEQRVNALAPQRLEDKPLGNEEGDDLVVAGVKHAAYHRTYKMQDSEKLKPQAPAAMQAAHSFLLRCDVDMAAGEQRRALSLMGDWQSRLTVAQRRIETVQADPQWSDQQDRQGGIAKALVKVTQLGAKAADTEEATDGEKTNDASKVAEPRASAEPLISAELHVVVKDAGEKAASAAAHLGKHSAPQANADQRQVIQLLEHTIQQMQMTYEVTADILLEELSDQWLAALEQVIMWQKEVSASTIEVWKKRTDDGGYRRSELLKLSALSRQQRRVNTLIDEMVHVMSLAVSGHQKVTFPPVAEVIVGLVRRDVDVVAERLGQRDAGEETQRLQRVIEERLIAMLEAMKPALSELSTAAAMADNSWGNPDVSSTTHKAEVLLLIALQDQISERTKALDVRKRRNSGLNAAERAELQELTSLQQHVRDSIGNILVGGVLERWSP